MSNKTIECKVVRVITGTGGMLLNRGEQFQFASSETLTKCAAHPLTAQPGDIMTLNHKALSINWQDPYVFEAQIYRVGNKGTYGECVIVRNLETQETRSINTGHVITYIGIDHKVSVSSWEEGITVKLAVTPYGWQRSEEHEMERYSPRNQGSHGFSSPEDSPFLKSFMIEGGSEDGS